MAIGKGCMKENALHLSNKVDGAAEAIRRAIGERSVDTLIILGSGLADMSALVEDPVIIPYGSIPGFAEPGVSGHIGELVVGRLGRLGVVVMRGKILQFEAAASPAFVVPMRAFKLLGVNTMFYSASVGSLHTELDVGRLFLVTDHINLLGTSPLLGDNDERFGPRLPDMSQTYDPDLANLVRQVAGQERIALGEGVYGAVRGPAFTSPAEIRMLGKLGVDVVGMSLVPEALLARHCGIRVVAVANVTNLGVGISDIPVDHQQTMRGAAEAKSGLARIIKGFCQVAVT